MSDDQRLTTFGLSDNMPQQSWKLAQQLTRGAPKNVLEPNLPSEDDFPLTFLGVHQLLRGNSNTGLKLSLFYLNDMKVGTQQFLFV